MKKQDTPLLIIAVLMIVAAAISRVLFYPLNYSPQIAMALFAGAVIHDKKLAFALPLFAMLLADVMFEMFTNVTGFWGWGQVFNYAIFALITIIGFSLKNITVLKVAGFSILSSLIFYFLSNSSIWLLDTGVVPYYPKTSGGYIACMVAGLPFLEKGLIVDLIYSGVFFGGYVLAGKAYDRRSLA
jgi:hypothetical protein